ncbi:MAG: ribonuclease HI family protein [Patescibacteria group bacterium]
MNIKIYTDGGSRGNPGPSAVGVWIETLDKKYAEYIGEGTNNEAEYQALILALKKVKQLIGKDKTQEAELECFSDSELMVKQLSHEYKLKDERIQRFFIEIWNLTLDFKKVIFKHVRREENKIADALVNEALDEKDRQKSLV